MGTFNLPSFFTKMKIFVSFQISLKREQENTKINY